MLHVFCSSFFFCKGLVSTSSTSTYTRHVDGGKRNSDDDGIDFLAGEGDAAAHGNLRVAEVAVIDGGEGRGGDKTTRDVDLSSSLYYSFTFFFFFQNPTPRSLSEPSAFF
jgi:hypothetical protein